MSTIPNDPALEAALASARALAERGDDALAERAFAAVLERAPGNVESATVVARYALGRGRPEQAIAHLTSAVRHAPAQPQLLRNLGAAYAAAGRFEESRDALTSAVALQPSMFGAWLQLGHVRERLGDRRGALVAFFRAVTRAQGQGHWLDERTTPAFLLDDVLHAMEVVRRDRRALFFGLLAPLRESHGAAALERVERCIAMYLRELDGLPSDPRQRPKFLYFPGVPSQPFYAAHEIPWIGKLVEAYPEIRAEAQAILETPAALEPFLEFDDTAQAGSYLAAHDGNAPSWDALFFYRHGERGARGHAACPRTGAALDALPLVRIREHAPEICFSVLTAGTEILPHHGVTNVRLVVHLPLVVPDACAIEVGGVRHEWREGAPVVFDDTYEHRAWNRSHRTRVILLMDAWNPHLSEVERVAVTQLIEAIGDLARA